MAKVFLHTKDSKDDDWNNNEFREFSRIPLLNEYIALDSNSEWYQIQLVVHCPFECSCDAEIYAIKVDYNGIMKVL